MVDLGPEDYLALIGAKTCWYTTIHPLRVGALVGSRGTADLDALPERGFTFTAVPPKVAGAGTFTVRAFATVETH